MKLIFKNSSEKVLKEYPTNIKMYAICEKKKCEKMTLQIYKETTT